MVVFAWHSWNFKENRVAKDKVINFSNLLVLNLLPFWKSTELHVYLIAADEQRDIAWNVWALISLPCWQVIPLHQVDGLERTLFSKCINMEIALCKGIGKTQSAFYWQLSSCNIFQERSFPLILLLLLLMIQVTFSVVNRNAVPLTPHSANLYFNEILIPTEIGSKLLKSCVWHVYVRLCKLKGQEKCAKVCSLQNIKYNMENMESSRNSSWRR